MSAGGAGALRGGGQSVLVTGCVRHGGAHGTPLAGQWAVLHEVRRGGGGPVDSVRTDARGRYVLRIPRLDSTAVYVVSAWYQDIAYFSNPVDTRSGGRAIVDPLVVYDTSSSGPPIRLVRRLLTVARPKPDGTHDVLEILALENPGTTTRVAADTVRPTWVGALPRAAIQFQVGEGDLTAPAVARRGDSVAVFAPLPPGVPRQLSYAYVIPAGQERLELPIDQWTGELDLLLEDTAAAVAAPGLAALGPQEIEQRVFARYRTQALEPGAAVTITLPRGRFRAQALLPYLVGLVAAALIAGLVVALRRRAPLAGTEAG